MRKIIVWGVAGVLAALALTGCDGGSHSSGSARGAPATAAGAGAAAPAAGSADSAASPAHAAGAPATGDGGTTLTKPPQSVIRTADLTLRVGHVDRQADRAGAIATAAGGQVFGDQRSGAGHEARADLVLHVPTGKLNPVLGELAKLGEQTALRTSAQDVTGKVADVDSRVASMRAAIGRLRTLYGKAGSIKDVLAVESTLAKREADLESLEAQQRALDAQTAMATVDVHLTAVAAPAAAKRASIPGFVTGIVHGWDAFVTAVRWTLTVLGAALPFLIAALVAATALLLRRRRGKRRLPGGRVG